LIDWFRKLSRWLGIKHTTSTGHGTQKQVRMYSTIDQELADAAALCLGGAVVGLGVGLVIDCFKWALNTILCAPVSNEWASCWMQMTWQHLWSTVLEGAISKTITLTLTLTS